MPGSSDNILDFNDERQRRHPLYFLINQHKFPLQGRIDKKKGRPGDKEEEVDNSTAVASARIGTSWMRKLEEIIQKDKDPRYHTKSDFVAHWVILGVRTSAAIQDDPSFQSRVEQIFAYESSLAYKEDIERQLQHIKGWQAMISDHKSDIHALENIRSAVVMFGKGAATETIRQEVQGLLATIDNHLRGKT